ncbi:proton-conducting transporter transmembrane domain-containing protein, partial [Eggerthella lenta]|uniref:proton-conducting transporter transmembrane domain-containing protein n=2 Tax=Bacillati TaxID=1783272 RepID=UPI0027D29781
VICKTGCTRIKDLKGMGRRMPSVMVCFALASLSLVGIPPAGGFLAKWHLAVGAMRAGAGLFVWLGPVVLMVSALLTAGYLFPVIVEAF